MNSICPVCRKEILPEDRRYMLALETPYQNVWFHFYCYKQNITIIPKILQETIDLWYNIKYNTKISRKSKENL